MTAESETQIPMDTLARVYLKIRDKVAQLTQEYDATIEGLKAQQEQVSHAMKDQMQELGVKSAKTEFGTVSLVTKTRFFAQDWDAMYKFIFEHKALDLLEKRVAQTNMAQFLENNPGVAPPGLNTTSSIEVSVRKPTKG